MVARGGATDAALVVCQEASVSATYLLPARCATSARKRYKVILADPPWSFQVWSRPAKAAYNPDNGKGGTLRGGRSAEDYYTTTPTDELRRYPVASLAADDCALFMWISWPLLEDALKLGYSWGFEYKTLGLDWLKRTPNGTSWHTGMGYWTRANSEACLLFTKGSPKRKSKGVKQLIVDAGQQSLFPPLIANVGEHSAKPFEQYSRIEALLDGPYLELFARLHYPGWDTWGLESPNCIDWTPGRFTLGSVRVDRAVAEGARQLALMEAG